MTDLYQKLYAYLIGQIDEAVTLLESEDLLKVQQARKLLEAALLHAEEQIIDAE